MVNKDTLVRMVYEWMRPYKLPLNQSEALVEQLLASISDTLIAGGEVKLRNIGVLRTVYPKRTAQTWLPGARGKVVGFRPTVRFKPSEVLRRSIRSNEGGE